MKTVKSTMFRNIANPRRTTLMHLKDADELQTAPELPEYSVELPRADGQPAPRHPDGSPGADARRLLTRGNPRGRVPEPR